MASPTIQYDAATGSDTAASGAGPAVALTGASATNGSGNVVNLDGAPNLSGVAADGSAVLWADVAGTNRNLSAIVAVDNGAKTVTTEDTLSLGAGVSWAIGGKRQTIEGNTSRRDFVDAKPGWTFSLAAGTYAVTGETKIGGGSASGGFVTIEASDPDNKPLFEGSHNGPLFDTSNGYLSFRSLRGTTSLAAGSRGSTLFARASTASPNGRLKFFRCEFYEMAKAWEAFFQDGAIVFSQCTIRDMDLYGVDQQFPTGGTVVVECCDIHGCGTYGVRSRNTNFNGCQLLLHGCRLWNNGDGLYVDTTDGSIEVLQSTIAHNVGDGIILDMTPSSRFVLSLKHTAITNNGGLGIRNDTGVDAAMLAGHNANNAFGLNTSGRTDVSGGWPIGEDEQTVTVDPYVDAANGDFTPNSDANGGDLLADTGRMGLPIGSVARPLEDGNGAPVVGGGPVIGSRWIQPGRGQ